MKKSVIISNCVIVAMLLTLVALSYSNAIALNVKADARVIYAGNTNQNKVSFMINVYQNEECVLDIMDIFDAYKVKATFFVGGCWAVKHLDVVEQICSRGFEIGNHGFHHKEHNKLSFEANTQEIKACHDVLLKNFGVEMTLFAPPSGAYNKTTVDAAESLNYKTIMWTHDTIDWRDQNEDLIFKRATKDLSNGDLILMHPTPKTVLALTKILAYSINNGFEPTTVSACLA